MYSVVLATVLVAGSAAPDFGGRGCHGCYGAAYGGCYGVCYGGWACSGCYGCYGGCGGCYGGCSGCWGCSGCYGGWSCHGCCGGWSSCYGGCYGGCSGCYGGCCGWSSCYGGCYGCSGCYGGCSAYVAPVYVAPVIKPAPVYSAAPNHNVQINPAPMSNVLPPPSGQVANDKQPATVVIKAAPDVKVLFNGKETVRKKAEEAFKTPDLLPGKAYSYDVVAEVSRDGKTYTTSQRVTVRAGERSEVSFGDAAEVIAAAQAEAAHITVLLPEGGKLYVDGQVRGSGAAKQTFDTPKLSKGKTYFYTLKVEVKSANNAGAKTQRVNVEAGKDVTVDFRSMFTSAD